MSFQEERMVSIFKYLKQCSRAAFSNQSNHKIKDYTSVDDNEFFY